MSESWSQEDALAAYAEACRIAAAGDEGVKSFFMAAERALRLKPCTCDSCRRRVDGMQ